MSKNTRKHGALMVDGGKKTERELPLAIATALYNSFGLVL
jgi:hypothetical protein